MIVIKENLNKFLLLIKNNYLMFILSIVIGLIYSGPNVLLQIKNPGSIPFIYTDYESYYLTRINGINKGCIGNCNPYIKEYGDKFPFFDNSVSEGMLGVPPYILGVNIVYIKIIYEFIFPALLSLLVYQLIVGLTKQKKLSAIGSLFVLLGYNLINTTDIINFYDLKNLIAMNIEYGDFLLYSRPVNPQFSTIFLFMFLNQSLICLKYDKKRDFIFLTLISGIIFHIYFFIYTYVFLIYLLIIIYLLIHKEKKKIKYFIISFVFFISAGIPVLIEILRLMNHKLLSSIPTEYLIHTHIPNISIIGILLFILTVIIFLIIYSLKKDEINTKYYFVFILCISFFITLNQHILTGMIMQYSHYIVYILDPIFIVCICYFISLILNHYKKQINNTVFFTIVLILIINSASIQYLSYNKWIVFTAHINNYINSLNWIGRNIENHIFAVPDEINLPLLIFTNNYLTWNYQARHFISLQDRRNIIDKRKNAQDWFKVNIELGAEYFIELIKNDIFKNDFTTSGTLEVVYVDRNIVIYKTKTLR